MLETGILTWAAEYPYNLDNTWEVSEYLTNKLIKIIANIYWALTMYFTWIAHVNLHSNLITHIYPISLMSKLRLKQVL